MQSTPATACGDRSRGSTTSPSMNSTRSANVCKIAEVAGAKIVEHAHLVAALDQRFGNVRADKAGSAGDQKSPHRETCLDSILRKQTAGISPMAPARKEALRCSEEVCGLLRSNCTPKAAGDSTGIGAVNRRRRWDRRCSKSPLQYLALDPPSAALGQQAVGHDRAQDPRAGMIELGHGLQRRFATFHPAQRSNKPRRNGESTRHSRVRRLGPYRPTRTENRSSTLPSGAKRGQARAKRVCPMGTSEMCGWSVGKITCDQSVLPISTSPKPGDPSAAD